jgi:proteic killer suppression protein
MEVEFKDRHLKKLEADPSNSGGYPRATAQAFRRRMNFIRAARDERDFYSMKSLHFEKLKGDRAHQRSIRLNDQWRLTLEIQPGNSKNKVVICGIEDYH